MEITFFKSPTAFRRWLEQHHTEARELWVGFHKKSSGKPSITWPESVDEALCFGWIDGIRKSVDDLSYTIRFTPRKPRSIWSAVNVKRAQELIRLGRMHRSGLEAFEKRTAERSATYSDEQRSRKLEARYERKLKANTRAGSSFKPSRPGISEPPVIG